MNCPGVYDVNNNNGCSNPYPCATTTAGMTLAIGIFGLAATATCAPTDDSCPGSRSMAIIATTIGAIAATALTALSIYESCKAYRERSISTMTQTTPLVTQVAEETLHTTVVL